MQDTRCSCGIWLTEIRRWHITEAKEGRLLRCPKCGFRFVEIEGDGITQVAPPHNYPKDGVKIAVR